MSRISMGSASIYQALENIEHNRYVIPAFQRNYVWTLRQIEKLWDSILQGYPINTFLYWQLTEDNVTPDMNFSEFKKDIKFDSSKKADDTTYNLITIDTNASDIAVLDGQQRLTSLYLSLYGETGIWEKYARRNPNSFKQIKLIIELNKNKIEEDDEFIAKKYDIRFTEKVANITASEFELRKILDNKFMNLATRADAINEIVVRIPVDSRDYARETLEILCKKIFDEQLIHYTLLEEMYQEDALELFVRFNNGGTRVNKAEITMSFLSVYWPEAKTKFNDLLVGPYDGFGTDFLVRTSLMIFGDVVKSNISMQVMNDLKGNWENFKNALNKTASLLNEFHVDIKRFKSGWNVLIPIIFSVYYCDASEIDREGIRKYLYRAVLFTYFQSGTTSKLSNMRNNIISYGSKITTDLLDNMTELKVTEAKLDELLLAEKDSRIAGEILYYLNLDWTDPNIKYERDHLYPKRRFWEGNPSGVTPQEWNSWRKMCDQMPNIWPLDGHMNASKSNKPLQVFYNEMSDEQKQEFRTKALIPDNVGLDIREFGTFYQRRKELIIQKLMGIL